MQHKIQSAKKSSNLPVMEGKYTGALGLGDGKGEGDMRIGLANNRHIRRHKTSRSCLSLSGWQIIGSSSCVTTRNSGMLFLLFSSSSPFFFTCSFFAFLLLLASRLVKSTRTEGVEVTESQ